MSTISLAWRRRVRTPPPPPPPLPANLSSRNFLTAREAFAVGFLLPSLLSFGCLAYDVVLCCVYRCLRVRLLFFFFRNAKRHFQDQPGGSEIRDCLRHSRSYEEFGFGTAVESRFTCLHSSYPQVIEIYSPFFFTLSLHYSRNHLHDEKEMPLNELQAQDSREPSRYSSSNHFLQRNRLSFRCSSRQGLIN